MFPKPTLPPIEKPTILIVEGIQDQYFFESFIKHLQLSNIQVFPIGGKTQIKANLGSLKLNSGFQNVKSLGIVRDADDNPGGAFQSVCGSLKAHNFPVPRQPLKAVIQDIQVSVLIMPDSDTNGSLEDLCIQAVAAEPAMQCVDQYFECLENQNLSLPKNLSKAKVQVFLAAIEAEIRLGEAARKGFWLWDHQAFNSVKEFLQQIALIPEE